LTVNFTNADNFNIGIEFQVSNNNIAFRYEIQPMKDRLSAIVQSEITGYRFPSQTTTFLSPMMKPMTGFARTAPSYESGYKADAELGTKSDYGYVFPGLFHIGNDGWILLSETGVNSLYCASHLDTTSEKIFIRLLIRIWLKITVSEVPELPFHFPEKHLGELLHWRFFETDC
jgi:hypothetical protein